MERETRNRKYIYDARQSRRAKHRRQVRLKKAGAIAILALMFLGACGVVFGVGYGIYRFVTSRKMVEEPYSLEKSTNIVLVDNVYSNPDNSVNTASAAETDHDPLYDELKQSLTGDEGSNGTGDVKDTSGNDTADEAFRKRAEKLVVVDAGHGGKDGGAIGVDNLLEKDCNLGISLFVREKLEKLGYKVYMSRSDDTFIPLNTRASKANELGADAFVSVHMNSFPDVNTVSGVEAWTYNREGCGELAQLLADKVSAATGAKNRGVSFAKNLVVTSKTEMPAVIIECGYITNPDEAAKLGTDEYRNTIAEAITDAVDTFLFGSEAENNDTEDNGTSQEEDPGENTDPAYE